MAERDPRPDLASALYPNLSRAAKEREAQAAQQQADQKRRNEKLAADIRAMRQRCVLIESGGADEIPAPRGLAHPWRHYLDRSSGHDHRQWQRRSVVHSRKRADATDQCESSRRGGS